MQFHMYFCTEVDDKRMTVNTERRTQIRSEYEIFHSPSSLTTRKKDHPANKRQQDPRGMNNRMLSIGYI